MLLLCNFFTNAQSDSTLLEVALELSRSQQTVVVYDSSEIKKTVPTKEQEEKVFSEGKMTQYQEKGAYKNIFDRFLEWLTEKIFDHAGPENVLAVRNIIIWLVVIASLAVVIWLVLRSDFASLVRPKSLATSFNFSDVTEDLDNINFEQKISAALSAGDFRLATRWHYLKILFLLDKKRFITFQPFKTNIDYGHELRNREKDSTISNELKGKTIYQSFVQLSRVYDYVWYGKFPVSAVEFSAHAADFEWFEKQINPQSN